MPISGWRTAIRARPNAPSSCCRQVTGRAGRTGLKSHGLLQTYQPQHPVMQAIVSGDAGAFYEREIAEREKAVLPPFGRLASIIVSADTRQDAETHARGMRNAAPQVTGIAVLGPAEAPLALVRGRHRFRLLVHGRRNSRHAGFSARHAGGRAEGAWLGARAARYRSAELSLRGKA